MPTILIVDDDAVIREILFDLLSEKYECHTASVAQEALQYLDVEDYDAVLTDIAMPGLTGVELLRRIQDRGLATPVIVISGKGGEEDGKLLLHLGAFAYLAKPFDVSEVEEVVARAVGRPPDAA